jgi:hypothetical protein
MKLVVTSMLALVAAANAETTSAPVSAACANPVVKTHALGFDVDVTLTINPQPFPKDNDGVTCQAFAGKDVCCDVDTLEQIAKAFAAGQEAIEEIQDSIQNNDYVTDLQKMVDSSTDLICNALTLFLPSLGEMCDNAADVVSDYTSKLGDAVEDVIEAELHCASALTKYYKGMLCFSCETDWDSYLVRDTDGEIVGVKLSSDTCTNLVDQCADVNDAVINVGEVAQEFITDLVDTVFGSSFSSDFDLSNMLDDAQDLCGGTFSEPGDCETFYCNSNAVSGFAPPTQRNWGMFDTMTSGSSMRKLAGTGSTVNVYSDDGYQAYSVGAADDPDGLESWVIAVAVVGSVLVLAGVAVLSVFLAKRARGTSRSFVSNPAPVTADGSVVEKDESQYEDL